MDSTTLSAIACGLAFVSLVLAIQGNLKARRIAAKLAKIETADGEIDLVALASAQAEQIATLQTRLSRIGGRMAELDTEVSASLRHMAVVRFNALREMGGQFSFAAALLDDNGNGIVFTSMQGQQSSRIYAKPILNGECELPLSPEELQAIENAHPKAAK